MYVAKVPTLQTLSSGPEWQPSCFDRPVRNLNTLRLSATKRRSATPFAVDIICMRYIWPITVLRMCIAAFESTGVAHFESLSAI